MIVKLQFKDLFWDDILIKDHLERLRVVDEE